jgi:glycosyltransferase involved in cell wall biosynthesis
MVKNGRAKLPALFESVKGFCDFAVILDTGSTDGTQEYCKKQDILPVRLYEEPFVDFGTSRTRGMSLCKDLADWILLLDDDMRLVLKGTPQFIKSQLDPLITAYLLQMDQRVTYWTTRLVSGSLPWRYVGVTHEYLDRSLGAVPLDGVLIEHHYHHGPEKFERDARLLAADIARDPYNARTIFYLAQTFRDMGHTVPAVRYYEMRVKMGGWPEEVFYAMYEAARLASDPNAMLRAFRFRPTRAEPAAWLRDYHSASTLPGARQLAEHWEDVRKKIPMSKDILFVDQNAYEKV